MLDDCDTVLTTVKFPSGVLMNIESQRECVYGYDQTIEVGFVFLSAILIRLAVTKAVECE